MSTISRMPRTRTPRRRMTLQEYLSGPPDEFKAELIYGEYVVSPEPTDEHNDLVHDLGEILRRWTRFLKLGKVSFDINMILDEKKDLAYAPDLLFTLAEHADRRRHGRVYGPADLCVEVLSPSDRHRIPGRKFADYEHYGVSWFWIIDPDPAEPVLEEHQLVEGRYVRRAEIVGNAWFEPGLFPGLHLRLPPLLTGDLKAAVKGKAKKLV
jgi:Uma2 family endonuclease